MWFESCLIVSRTAVQVTGEEMKFRRGVMKLFMKTRTNLSERER